MKTFSIFGESRQPFQMNYIFKHPKPIYVVFLSLKCLKLSYCCKTSVQVNLTSIVGPE